MRELPNLTLPQMLRENARTMPERLALRQKDFGIWLPISWAQYDRRARHFGLGLRALGLGEGGHVGILSENRAEWVVAQLGAGMVNAVAIGVYATSPANEVAYVLGHAEVEIVVCEDQEQTDKVLERLEELPRLKRIVVIDPKGLRGYASELVISFADVLRSGADHEVKQPGLVEACLAAQTQADIGLMVYTSGSTGKPKGAMLSYRNMRAQAAGVVERLGYDAATTNLSYLPLCHVAEQMLSTMAPIYVGSCVSFGESIRTVQEDLREVAPTLFLGVPRIWEKLHASIHIKLMEAGGWRRRLFEAGLAACEPFATKPRAACSLRERALALFYHLVIFRALQNFIGLRKAKVALTGAAPIPPRIVQFFRTLGVPLVEVYGLTETSGMATGQRLDHLLPGSVGEAVAGTEAKLGDQGELLVRGDIVFEGYFRSPEATAGVLRDGWLHTGDVAVIEAGQVKIVDRLKDIMITAGGKNLSPSEIENTVKGSAFIKECIVVADGRRYPSALIQIDAETVGKWAEENRIAFTHFRSLAEHERVRDLVAAEIEQANSQLAPVAQLKRFHMLVKELDHDDDEVTATMKVRRASIAKKYAAEIEALYKPERQAEPV
ncbi:Long-chain acyl-CoA synthetase [Bosea sp. 62]|uniref:AMP-dependent synthetase/ligase n=1 Tax=unclassified Bosea (in: a-proteobacteria) TaxID=2653178 RepID=UPI0012555B9E|nr:MULTISPECIES: AMP-binding protein [unclassified Bosea (in: a-proteobacteria)]CAD5252156.1 Long-chain acyl-CoA synthetase [Bosea sp. 46]CAD5256821.1 Long-chain acyl-CoA synthetase [Bosea sp. 21B]CAD5284246.1 Long-chain acyl-CoA synthetase [Bosea sp. 7B]VVT56443.1 Long-chain acyl-CoA synthetase [Bosea sp. EC-HK365B]VXB33097.1 Long-chain acyl-CoA synthetase [Bosea sp. 29B]